MILVILLDLVVAAAGFYFSRRKIKKPLLNIALWVAVFIVLIILQYAQIVRNFLLYK